MGTIVCVLNCDCHIARFMYSGGSLRGSGSQINPVLNVIRVVCVLILNPWPVTLIQMYTIQSRLR